MKNDPRRVQVSTLLAIPATLWLVVFCVIPLLLMVVMSFWKSDLYGLSATWTLENYVRLFTDWNYLRVLGITIRVAVVSTIISLIVAYPVAWFLSQQTGARKNVLLILIFLPFWTSYIVRTFVWLPILGRSGLINQILLSAGVITAPVDWLIYNEGATYLGLVYVYLLYMLLPVYLSLDRLDRRLIEAAADLGAGRYDIFRKIVFPLSLPGVLSGCVMVFLLSCGAFVTPQLLGGPSAIMFGNLIASQFSDANNWAFGSALSIVLVCVVLLLLALVGRRVGMQRIFLGGAS